MCGAAPSNAIREDVLMRLALEHRLRLIRPLLFFFTQAALKAAAFLVLEFSEKPFTHLINILGGLVPSFLFSCRVCVCVPFLLTPSLLVRWLVLLLLRVKSSEQQLALRLLLFLKKQNKKNPLPFPITSTK